MLTDYHTHLRPDDRDPGSAERYFTEENVDRYLSVASERGIAELGFSEHVYRFREALAIWRHPFWQGYAVDDLDAYCEFLVAMRERGRPIKVGLEVDWIPGREDRIGELIEGRPFDYVIGSVHFITDGAVDHEDYDAWRNASSDDVWRHYFRTLGEAAASGLFDILAHPDLVKVWGAGRPRPEREPRAFYELALEGMASSGVAIEVSTAGLRKPVGEIYPAPELLDLCLAAGNPVALSSDAHEPDQIGHAYESAVGFLRAHGVETLSVFSGRRRSEERLG